MIEHIGNCHGEWNWLIYLLGLVPFIGPLWLARLRGKHKH